ncbi:UBC-like protein [Aspergillus uvarum CBS 121591]|uniref:Ubiquitin-conjugating enzyme E2 2 n=1 Tax=Aspergillus uvarum CBS 121591 TaxID=1448315 RepID=A0A319C9S8_9EURO|nr:UBC-like protein [Aspergillus uvarum CBS 121591]PYH80437.1 UBC-like protein [Aspergillus uvarum CBS 121591]
MEEVHRKDFVAITRALTTQPASLPPNPYRRVRAELLAAVKDGPYSPPQCQFVSFAPAAQNDLLNMIGTIAGSEGTPYEGGLFQISLSIPLLYPSQPPTCRFATKIWHPNVSHDGRICLNLLDEDWSKALSIRTILISVAALLGSPGQFIEEGGTSSPLRPEAAEMWLENLAEFEKTAQEWTRRYAMSVRTED